MNDDWNYPGTNVRLGEKWIGTPGDVKLIARLSDVSQIILTGRAFNDESVPHPEVTVDPDRDIHTMDLELAFADAAQIERRLGRLETELRSMKPGERDQSQRLKDLLLRIKAGLEADIPVRAQELNADDWKLLESTQFLTALPLLVLVNIGEEDLSRLKELESEHRARHGEG